MVAHFEISPNVVSRLNEDWDDRDLWVDIEVLAGRAWTTNVSPASDEHLTAWHHLVIAVGNFKRPGGRRLHPAHLRGQSANDTLRDPQFNVPCVSGGALGLSADTGESWETLLAQLPGAGVPTLTTLLAALWPKSHSIADRRVVAAAAGLSLRTDGVEGWVQPTSVEALAPTLNLYSEQLRPTVLATAGRLEHADETVTLQRLERCLYQMDREARRAWRKQRHRGQPFTWQLYADLLPVGRHFV